MEILLQFVLRLAFGLAVAMALTPPAQVTAGFYRVHAYVLMGLHVLAALVASSLESYTATAPIVGATLSYVASIVWLNEKRRAGIVLLLLIGVAAFVGIAWGLPLFPASMSTGSELAGPSTARLVLEWIAPVAGGLVLGTTITAMFLGHWYLNTPTMELSPLRRLIILMTVSLLLRMMVSGTGLALLLTFDAWPEKMFLSLLLLRCFSGILLPLVLAWMTWKTLDVPNTQSATGILYVGVVTTFTGELTAQLLSSQLAFPV